MFAQALRRATVLPACMPGRRAGLTIPCSPARFNDLEVEIEEPAPTF